MNVLNEEVRMLQYEIAVKRKLIEKINSPVITARLMEDIAQLEKELNDRLEKLQ